MLLNKKYNLIKLIANFQPKRTNLSHRMYPKIRQYKPFNTSGNKLFLFKEPLTLYDGSKLVLKMFQYKASRTSLVAIKLSKTLTLAETEGNFYALTHKMSHRKCCIW